MKKSTIRREFARKKKIEEKIIEEAARAWLRSNVVFINEKIDRRSVDRLIDSIQKFEDKFGPYRDSLPEVSNIIDRAEGDLQNIIMGKISDQRAGDVLEYLSFIYSALSSFFSKDLPVLLKANMFRAAKSNPSTPMKDIENEGFDIKVIKKSLANAVEPSAEEKKMLRGLMKRKYDINSKAISEDLVKLSYDELVELTAIEKTPIVSIGDENTVLEIDVSKKA